MSGSISPDSEAASIDLSDEEFDELLSESSTTKANNPADDLLSAFQDDDEEIDSGKRRRILIPRGTRKIDTGQ